MSCAISKPPARSIERLGFQVGARNRHPWGTENRLVQFPGFFLEILAVVEPEKIAGATFGAFNQKFLGEVGEGLSGLVVEGRDPKGERAALDAAGFGGIPFEFSRKGKRADGTEVEVGFKIAFAHYPAAAHALFFTSQQTAPENFWSPSCSGIRTARGRSRPRCWSRKIRPTIIFFSKRSPACAISTRARSGSRSKRRAARFR